MAKKKNKSQVINNIQDVTLEIDYDKLAEAIVIANKKFQELEEKSIKEENEKLSFKQMVSLIWAILRNKAESNGHMTSNFMAMIMSLFFNCLAIASVVVSVVVFIAFIVASCGMKIASCVELIGLGVFVFLMGLMIGFIFRATANEISKEGNRNYIVSVFSALTSFLALIISAIALVKGVA